MRVDRKMVISHYNDGLKEKANNGSLYKRVVSLKDMPKGGYALTDQERTYFATWINQGASNN